MININHKLMYLMTQLLGYGTVGKVVEPLGVRTLLGKFITAGRL